MTSDPIERARLAYERAVFGGDPGDLTSAEAELDGLEADVALARGRLLHARFLDPDTRDDVDRAAERALFERALALFQRLGDTRGAGEALFWIGCFLQVVDGDGEGARPVLERSLQSATDAGDRLTASYALRHLGIDEHQAGQAAEAERLLERSTALRRELGFHAGVSANLIGLAYVAADRDELSRADELLDEAAAIAREHAPGMTDRVAEARDEIRP